MDKTEGVKRNNTDKVEDTWEKTQFHSNDGTTAMVAILAAATSVGQVIDGGKNNRPNR